MTVGTVETICQKAGHKPSPQFEYGAIQIDVERSLYSKDRTVRFKTLRTPTYSDTGNFVYVQWKQIRQKQ